MITPDITPDHGAEWIAAADAHDLDKVFLVAPSSTDDRIAMTAVESRGFVYAAAVMGVTGARDASSDLAGPLVRRVRAAGDIPVAVGIGVSTGDQAAEVAAFADGVIVGLRLRARPARPPRRRGRRARGAAHADHRPRRGRTPCPEVGPCSRSRCLLLATACGGGAGADPARVHRHPAGPRPVRGLLDPAGRHRRGGVQPHRGHRQGPHAGLLRLHPLPRHLRPGDGHARRHAGPPQTTSRRSASTSCS